MASILVAVPALNGVQSASALAIAPSLGTASSFGVLAGSTVVNTGPTTITGNVGVSPGTAITGFPPATVSFGTIHSGDAVADARRVLLRARLASVIGTLTLDAQGNPNAVFVFQTNGTLTTALHQRST